MGVPQARWMVYFMENPKIKWMRTRGPPISGNLHLRKMAYFERKTAEEWRRLKKISSAQLYQLVLKGVLSHRGTPSSP